MYLSEPETFSFSGTLWFMIVVLCLVMDVIFMELKLALYLFSCSGEKLIRVLCVSVRVNAFLCVDVLY